MQDGVGFGGPQQLQTSSAVTQNLLDEQQVWNHGVGTSDAGDFE